MWWKSEQHFSPPAPPVCLTKMINEKKQIGGALKLKYRSKAIKEAPYEKATSLYLF